MNTTSTTTFSPLTRCPACAQPSLRPAEAEPLLPSRRCADCSGQFIRGEQYYRWLDHPDRSPQTALQAEAPGDVIDTPWAKICPECGKLMRRYRIGNGLAFVIDRCSACAGIWFDANEWDALRRQGLHDRVHFVFSDAWRMRLLRDELDRIARRRVEAKIGSQNFAELQRVTEWIEQHPHREEVIGYLMTRLRGAGVACHPESSLRQTREG